MRRLPIFVGFFALIVSLPLTVFLATQKRTSWFTRARTADKVQLWLWPVQVELNQDETASIKVILDTKDNQSGGVDLVLRYDSQALEVVDNLIEPGVIFPYYRDRLVDNRRGLMRLSSKGEFSGQGVFASFAVRGLRSGKSRIEIMSGDSRLDASVVWNQTETQNILGRSDGLEISISQ